ncbi:MAG TPA: HEAT repeat domain-containing protein [Candidatus Sulfotelmatobacter sp.]|nr:HEAT repeat domain-containing protein [Candidatus Sulfotelmatobacter sp.]
MAGRVERVLNAGLSGEPTVALSVNATDLLTDAVPVAAVISAALDRPGAGLTDHRLVIAAFRRSGLSLEILDHLVDAKPEVRAAAARICGALKLPEAIPWIGEMLEDRDPTVRDTAIRALGRAGGRRAVEILMDSSDRIPLYRLAIVLAQATSDLDIEALMRRPASEKAAVATVLACGLRRDVLRIPPLLGIAHDRRWPRQVRVAACKALAMIGDPSAADGLSYLAESDPDAGFKGVARRAHRRLLHRAKRVSL